RSSACSRRFWGTELRDRSSGAQATAYRAALLLPTHSVHRDVDPAGVPGSDRRGQAQQAVPILRFDRVGIDPFREPDRPEEATRRELAHVHFARFLVVAVRPVGANDDILTADLHVEILRVDAGDCRATFDLAVFTADLDGRTPEHFPLGLEPVVDRIGRAGPVPLEQLVRATPDLLMGAFELLEQRILLL